MKVVRDARDARPCSITKTSSATTTTHCHALGRALCATACALLALRMLALVGIVATTTVISRGALSAANVDGADIDVAGQRGLVSGAAVVAVLCFAVRRWRRQALRVSLHRGAVSRPCLLVIVTALLLLLLAPRVGATTCSEALESSYSCYDPTGASCTCTGGISLSNQGVTGTLPAALSACTGVTYL